MHVIDLSNFVTNYSQYSAVLPISVTVKLLDYQDYKPYASITSQYSILTTKEVYLNRYKHGGDADNKDTNWSLQGEVIANIDHTFTKQLTTIKYQIILNGIAVY